MSEMTCDQVEDLLPEILDGTLSPGLIDEAVHHIANCDACTFTKGQVDKMQALFRDHGSLRLPEPARARIRATLDG